MPDRPEHTTPSPGPHGTAASDRAPTDLPSSPVDPPRRGFLGELFQTDYREVTVSAIVFGVVVGAVMNAAITYAGLKIGFTIVGSSIAAVLGFGVLRGLLRRGSILEVNIGQTIASAVNTPNSGVIFTVPVLFLLGIPLVNEINGGPNTNFWLLTLACVAGAVLGCAFIVPLRKQMLDIERLRFPSAVAVGTILKSPGAGAKKSILLVLGILLSALIAVPAQLPQIGLPASLENLDALVHDEKISYTDKLRTEMIADWIDAQQAPEEVVALGALLHEIGMTRDALADLDSASPEAQQARQTLAELESRVPDAESLAQERTAALTQEGPFAVREFPRELALRAHAAAVAEGSWEDLRSMKTGWAVKPLFGYSDLNIRVAEKQLEGVEPLDFAYNGLGTQDPVLTHESDRDRGGRPDLLVTDTTVDVGRFLGLPPEAQLVFAIAPFALGAGYLSGRAGLFVLAGGILAYLVLNPVLYNMGLMPETISASEAPAWGFGHINRPLGIGLLLGGAFMGIVASLPAIKEAMKSIAFAGKAKAGADELGIKVLIAAVILGGALLFLAADFTAGQPINHTDPLTQQRLAQVQPVVDTYNGYAIGFESPESAQRFAELPDAERTAVLDGLNADRPGLLSNLPSHVRAAIIALIGMGWIWFAGIIIAQCTGMTDWSPISGMALLTVVLVMILSGVGDVLAAVLLGAALCVAITCAADMMADLKTGYIVGAQPKRQQVVEMVCTSIGPVITMGVLLLIAQANLTKFGVAMGPGTDTTAPQAQALQAIITGVQGGALPYLLYGGGAILGAILGLGSFAGLGVLVGLSMYLPMIYIATYGIGCVVQIITAKIKGPRWAEEWGVPLAAGFVVGDALLGLGVNLAVLIQAS